jgi:hypothetical protein
VVASRSRSAAAGAGFLPFPAAGSSILILLEPFRSFLQHSRFHFQQKGVGLPLFLSRKQFSRHHSRDTASAIPVRIGNHLARDRRVRTGGQSIRSSHSELCRRMFYPLLQLTAGDQHFTRLAEQLQPAVK